MAVIGGVLAAVNGISTEFDCKMELTNTELPYVTSNSKAGEIQGDGIEDWRGMFKALGHSGVLATVKPGFDFSFDLNLENGKGYSGTAMAEMLDILCNVETGELIQYTCQFGRNGPLTLGSSSGADATNPAIFEPTGRAVFLNGVKQTDTRYWRLRIRNKVKKYVSSETNSAVKRVKGHYSADFEFAVYYSDPSVLPVRNTNYSAEFFVTDVLKWHLEWAKVKQIQDIGVKQDDEKPVTAVIRGVHNAFYGTGYGTIVAPDGTVLWPEP